MFKMYTILNLIHIYILNKIITLQMMYFIKHSLRSMSYLKNHVCCKGGGCSWGCRGRNFSNLNNEKCMKSIFGTVWPILILLSFTIRDRVKQMNFGITRVIIYKSDILWKFDNFSKFWEICQNWLFCHFFKKSSYLRNGKR